MLEPLTFFLIINFEIKEFFTALPAFYPNPIESALMYNVGILVE